MGKRSTSDLEEAADDFEKADAGFDKAVVDWEQDVRPNIASFALIVFQTVSAQVYIFIFFLYKLYLILDSSLIWMSFSKTIMSVNSGIKSISQELKYCYKVKNGVIFSKDY